MEGLNQNSGPSLILVKTALDKLRADEAKDYTSAGKAEATDPLIFTQDTATNAAVVNSVIGGGGYFDKTTDDLRLMNKVAPRASAPKTTLIAEFNKELDVARTFMADQQLSAVSKSVKQQTRTWLASRDRNAFNVYANGFGTQTTIDGVATFSNSHINQNGDIVDNLETGVLTVDNLNVGINSLRTQVAQTGVIDGVDVKFLLVSSLGHMNAMAITKSVLRAGGGNNDLNYFSELYPGMQVKFSPFLDTTSTTAWFIGSSNHGIVRYEREAFFTEMVDWKFQKNNQYVYKMLAREEVDSIEYTGLVGSNGTV